MSMAARRSTSPLPSSSCTRHAAGPSAGARSACSQAGGRRTNRDIKVAKVPSLVERRGLILASSFRRASRAESLPKSWHPVPVAIRSGEPHGGDRAGPDGTPRTAGAPLERGGENQVPAAAERQPGQHVGLGAGERPAGYLPGRSCAVVHPVAGRADDRPGPGRRRRRRPRCPRFAVLPVPGGTPPATAYPAPSRSVPRQPRASGQQVRRMGLACDASSRQPRPGPVTAGKLAPVADPGTRPRPHARHSSGCSLDGRRHAAPPMRGNFVVIRYPLRAVMVLPAAHEGPLEAASVQVSDG